MIETANYWICETATTANQIAELNMVSRPRLVAIVGEDEGGVIAYVPFELAGEIVRKLNS